MGLEDQDTAEPSFKNRIAAQLAFFKGQFLSKLGITSKEASQFDSFIQIDPNLPPEKRQLLLKERIYTNLNNKGILATKEENLEFFKERFHLDPGYAAPELYLQCPGGACVPDKKTNEVKIYLNPLLNQFKPDYQLLTVMEESIHYYQLKHSGRTKVNNQDETEAKDKILKMADFLGLSAERREYVVQARESYGKDPSN